MDNQSQGITRRQLLKGAAALGTTAALESLLGGCATFDPKRAKDAKEFDIKAFNDWYEMARGTLLRF